MSIKINQINIPKLRFSEFSDEWNKQSLKEISKIYDGTHQTPKYVKSGIKFVSVEDINNINGSNKFITEEAFEKDFRIKPQKDDILMTRITAGIIGATSVIKDNNPLAYYVSLSLIRKTTNIDVDFLNQIINSSQFKHELYKRIIHVAFPKKINLNDIGDCKLSIPLVKEQQKIAEFLESADSWIENLKQQKKSLEVYKKGMMQKIFAQEIRFKDENGNDFLKWEEKKLSETGNIITGTTPPTKIDDYYGGDFPWITPTDITSNKNIHTSNKLLTKKGLEKGRFVPKNSLLVTCIASIGKNSILRVDGSCNQQINAITLNKNNNVDFLYYLIEQNKNTLISFAGAGGMQMLNKNDFSNIKFKMPTFHEQQKIADFLTSIDKIIDSKQEQIVKADEWKKGLMQGLFV